MPIKKRLIKVGDSRAVTIPPGWLKYYEDEFGEPIEEVLMELNNVITLAVVHPKTKQVVEFMIPTEDIILPYPKEVDTDDEERLSVAAYIENYERIHSYVSSKKPDWKAVGVNMETIKVDGLKFLKVTRIFNATPIEEKWRA